MTLTDRNQASQQAKEWLARQPLFLDTETTGTGPNAEIIEIALVDHTGQTLIDTLVRPRGPIEQDAQRVHGITPADVKSAPTWDQVWPQIEAAIGSRPVGAYNSDFDLRLMQQSHKRAFLRWTLPERQFFCLMKLYARFYGEWDPRKGSYRWQTLDNAGRQCGIILPNTHRALDDTLLARALLLHMAAQGV